LRPNDIKTIANFDCLKILPITIKAMIKLKKYATVAAIWCLGAIESEAQSRSIGLRADYILNSGPRIALGVTKMGERLEHTAIIGVDKPRYFNGGTSLGMGYGLKYKFNKKLGIELVEYVRLGDFWVSQSAIGPGFIICNGALLFEHSMLIGRVISITKALQIEPKVGTTIQHGYRSTAESTIYGDVDCTSMLYNLSWFSAGINFRFIL
jgi:hypothetical protein